MSAAIFHSRTAQLSNARNVQLVKQRWLNKIKICFNLKM